MRYRQLGKHGPIFSEIGLGTWAMGGQWAWGWGPQDDADSLRAIYAAFKKGINWVDTAPIYGFGHAESLIGKAVTRLGRENIYIATKCGLPWDDRRKVRRSLRPDSIRREIEGSLRRLRTDYIDLYQHHWPDPNTSVVDSWGELVRLKKEGKVRHIGVCNYDARLLLRCQNIAPVQSLQTPLSMIRREALDDLLPLCREHGIALLAYSPLQNGLLTDTFTLEKLAEDDWRRKDDNFKEPALSRHRRLVEKLRLIARSRKLTVAQLALSWVVQTSPLNFAIAGARNAAQALENAAAGSTALTAEELHQLTLLLQQT